MRHWKDKTLAYYASQGVEMTESEDLDAGRRVLKRRNELCFLANNLPTIGFS